MNKNIQYPHSLSIKDVSDKLAANTDGLSTNEVKKRLLKFGSNELPAGKSVPLFVLFLKQFKSWLVAVLIIAAVISWFTNHIIDSWVILGIVFINAIIGFTQEYRAEKAIATLQKMIVKNTKVLRDGKLNSIPTKDLVPGDVVVLEEGDSIPADGRIFHFKNFRTVESSLTGESTPVSKRDEIYPIKTSLADRKNMVWKGTFVAGGYAKVIVTGTGKNTAIGDISELLEGIEEKRTNFMLKTDVLVKQMSVIAVISAVIIFLVGYFYRGFNMEEILLTSIAALVAAVPEGLPAVITIVLATGAHRMAKRNAIIREFTATETLGAVTAILTDKTGTLTKNSLTVKKVFVTDEPDYDITGEGWEPLGKFSQDDKAVEPKKNEVLQKLLKIAAVSNNAEFRKKGHSKDYELIGDPTEGALLVLSKKAKLNQEQLNETKLDDLPFDSTLKLRASLFETEKNKELYVVGAPEKLLNQSSKILTKSGEIKLGPKEKKQIENKISEWSNNAMRIIAVAYKKQEKSEIVPEELNDLIFVGLTGMIDPPRPDAKKAVTKCKRAGIRVIMVTGDHINTAVAIAKASGIIDDNNDLSDGVALTEDQLLKLNEAEFDKAIAEYSVFARLSPKTKLKIAERLQAQGHLIAMTGDGVNDAPAIKRADVGISMGIMGTDVSREASDMVLADDNFATIVNAVEEGRIVFANSRQTSFFLITTNIAESVTLVFSITIGLPLTLTATQLLWLNLVTDGVTAISLATEGGHGDVMLNKPLNKDANILNKEVFPFLIINVILMASLTLATFLYYLDSGVDKARTGAFVVMGFTQLFNVFNLRSIHESVFKIGLFSNKFINIAIGFSAAILIVVTEIPQVASIFHFQSISYIHFVVLFTFSSSILWVGELYKYINNRNVQQK